LYSPPYNPQNNGKSERFNYTLVSCAKTLLYWSKLDTKFWDYAVKYANLLYNKAPHQGIGNKIPEELFYNKPSNLKYIKVFGCRAYFKDFSKDKMKFKNNAIKGVFLGFNTESYCYIVMDYKNLKIHYVREVVFDESTPGKLILNGLNSNINNNKVSSKYFNLDNYSININNDNETNNQQQNKINQINNQHQERINPINSQQQSNYLMKINNDNTITKNIDNENQIITEDQPSTSTIEEKIEKSDNPENDIIDSETSFPSDIYTEIFDNDNFSYNDNSIDNSQENHIENLTSNFKAISMSTEIDNSSNYIDNNVNDDSTNHDKTGNQTYKRKENKIDSAANKRQKKEYNTVSSSLKRPGSPLYNEENKRSNFIIDNIELNNIITDTPLTFK